ncbi:MAG: hypothetical protein QM734_04400, partial [Cyclobacteriaceae bacterium]
MVQNSGIYSSYPGNNFIGAYDSAVAGVPGAPIPIQVCSPCGNGDYVGTSAHIIDPMLSTLQRSTEYQPSYSLLTGSPALLNHAGLFTNSRPAIASYGLFPANGHEGDQITIYGKNLSTVYEVDFEVLFGFYRVSLLTLAIH